MRPAGVLALPLVLLVMAQVPAWRTQAHAALYGESRTIQLFVVRGSEQSSFSVRAERLQLSLAPLDAGNTARSLGSRTKGTVASALGQQMRGPLRSDSKYFYGRDYAEVQYPLPADLRAGMYAVSVLDRGAVFDSSGAGITLATQPNPALVYAPQLHDDPGLAEARRRYVGKTVYGTAGSMSNVSDFTCEGSPGGDARLRAYQSATILSIRRSIGTAEMGFFWNTDADFLAFDPLIVEFSAAPGNPPTFARPPGFTGPWPPARACTNRVGVLADLWEIERHFALHDPSYHPGWPARFQAAFKQHTVVAGMTHEMVAAVVGYPAAYGTVAQLDRLSHWHYDSPTPFSSDVYFRGDSVVRYDPPGNLP